MPKLYIRLLTSLIPIILFCTSPTVSFSQELHRDDPHEIHTELMSQYPELRDPHKFEEWLHTFEEWLQSVKNKGTGSANRMVYTLPVVFHIIHTGGAIGAGTNVPESRVLSQMEVLNEDFRRAPGTPGFNTDSIGADAEIEFCLAYIDPDSIPLSETGIDRISIVERGFIDPPYSTNYINTIIKPQTIWDPNKYFNIWVVPGISGGGDDGTIAGFATFPVRTPGIEGFFDNIPNRQTDGIVVGVDFLGRAPGTDGRTATHEAGHFLGLFHLSDIRTSEDPCSANDFCDDTPVKDDVNNGCNLGSSTCGSVDQLENYMIRLLGPCRNLFTICQVDRMRTVLENAPQRVELLSSTVCTRPTEAPVADFTIDTEFSCDGRFRFVDQSSNLPSNWFWIFDNGIVDSVKNPVITIDEPGPITVTLIANSPLGTSPAVTKTFNLSLGETGAVSAGEDIAVCVGDQVTLQATLTGTGDVSWTPSTGLSNPNTLNPVLTPQGNTSYIVTATGTDGCTVEDTLNVSAVPQPTTLIVASNTEINAGESVQLNAIGAANYLWSPSASLSDSTISNPVASPTITTTYTVRGFNNAGCEKLDSVTVVVNELVSISDAFELVANVFPPFPNPSENLVELTADFTTSGDLVIDILDMMGKKVATIYEGRQNLGQFSMKWIHENKISSGMYLVNWKMQGLQHFQKIHIK